jgi:hypothetical protein
MTQQAPESAPAPSNGPAPAPSAPAGSPGTPPPGQPAPSAPASTPAPQTIDPAEFATLRTQFEELQRRHRELAREAGTLRSEREQATQAGQTETEQLTSRANRAESRAEQYRGLAYRMIRQQAVMAAAREARYRNPSDAFVALGGSGALNSIEVDEDTGTVKDPKAVLRLVQEAITPDRQHWLVPEGTQPGDPPSAPQFGGPRQRDPGEMSAQQAIASSRFLSTLGGRPRQ